MQIEVAEQSQAGDARRKAVACAEKMHMSELRSGQIAIAATELATNLIKHAGRGHVLVQELRENGNSGIRIVGVDKGPGIHNVGLALEDGHSTTDSMGTGLGAVRRLSDVFDLYTGPGTGTVVQAEFWTQKLVHRNGFSIEAACVSEPIRGEQVNGDGWALRVLEDATLVLVADGLGHGVFAAEAAREAERVVACTSVTSAEGIVHELHLALRKTRGAAAGVVRIDPGMGLLFFSGVGNICASVVGPKGSRSLASHNGTLGHQITHLQQFTTPWNSESVLVMHSDGLSAKWDLSRYPGLFSKPPSLIAAVLHRDFCRDRDDVTVLAARAAQPHGELA